jgi:hypothetical protein
LVCNSQKKEKAWSDETKLFLEGGVIGAKDVSVTVITQTSFN